MTSWETLQPQILRDFANLHNQIVFKQIGEKVFDEFVSEQQEKMKHPKFLFIFAERVKMQQTYFEEHKKMCQFFYEFMKANPEWEDYNFGFHTHLRLGVFFELFKAFLEGKEIKSVEA